MIVILAVWMFGITITNAEKAAKKNTIDLVYDGCYKENVSQPDIFDLKLEFLSRLSPQLCAKSCGGYSVLGLEKGSFCGCAKSFDGYGTADLDKECYWGCRQNTDQECGGDSHISVYNIDCAPVASYNINGIGCFADSINRDMGSFSVMSEKMTIDMCAQVCANHNFLYMGLQNGTICFCDNKYGSQGFHTQCNVPCIGNRQQKCGGYWMNYVYEINAVVSGCDGEPHFMFVSDNTHFCFSLHGKDDEIFNVITDPANDIYVRGSTFEITVEDSLLSYFSDIGITIGYGENKQTMVFDRQQFKINGEIYNYQENFKSFESGDVKVRLIKTHPYKYLIEIKNDIYLVVNRAFNPRIGNFLGVYVQKRDGFTNNVGGILGQFIHTKFKVIEDRNKTMIKFDDDHETVPVSKIPMFMPSTKKPIDCYFYFGVQRGGLIGDKSLYQENTLLKSTNVKHTSV